MLAPLLARLLARGVVHPHNDQPRFCRAPAPFLTLALVNPFPVFCTIIVALQGSDLSPSFLLAGACDACDALALRAVCPVQADAGASLGAGGPFLAPELHPTPHTTSLRHINTRKARHTFPPPHSLSHVSRRARFPRAASGGAHPPLHGTMQARCKHIDFLKRWRTGRLETHRSVNYYW